MGEFEDLLQKVRETDFSVNNPDMQAVYEHELVGWVKSYQYKKKMGLHDCYGSLGDIPEKIYLDGENYSPSQILEHVQARDEVGMNVIEGINFYHICHPIWKGDKLADVISNTYNNDLDEFAMLCCCGQHNKTTRDVINDVIHPNKDSLFITAGISDSIMKWYGVPDRYDAWKLGQSKTISDHFWKVVGYVGIKKKNSHIMK